MNKIEGGPECEAYKYAQFAGAAYWKCIDGRMMSWSYETDSSGRRLADKRIYDNDLGVCPRCKGTAVKPLSEWTADQLTEWLARAGFEFSEIDCLNATKEFTEWGITGFITGGQIGACEKGFTNTLRALVAAIAERKSDETGN